MRKLANIFWLGTKELRSFTHDFVLLGLVFYAFSFAVIMEARSNAQELHNASIAFVDEDGSELSRRIAHAFLPPYFKPPQMITEREIIPSMNAGRYTFVVDIPPNFQRDVLGGRRPGLQVNVDATAGILEGIQMVWSNSGASPDEFFPCLWPVSAAAWHSLNRFWSKEIPFIPDASPSSP